MQKLATSVFIGASLSFAVLGIIIILSEPGRDDTVLTKSFMISILVILSSFAVIVAHLSIYAVRAAQKYLRSEA